MFAEPNNYVVGKGKLLFERYANSTIYTGAGMRYLGNTPALSLNRSQETLDHFSSEGGIREKDMSVDIEDTTGGSFSTDNINGDNVAMFFGGEKVMETVTSGTAVENTFVGVGLGNYYQLGESDDTPGGLQNVSAVVVKVGATTIDQAGNYEVDAVAGLLFILPDAADIVEGDDVIATFDHAATVQEIVISRGDSVYGRMRFIADNPVGTNRDYIWPLVKLTADGDYELKGQDWQNMSFTFETLKRPGMEKQYIVRKGA